MGKDKYSSTYVSEKDHKAIGKLTVTLKRESKNIWKLHLVIDLNNNLPELPRAGVRFKLPKVFEKLSWYGRRHAGRIVQINIELFPQFTTWIYSSNSFDCNRNIIDVVSSENPG